MRSSQVHTARILHDAGAQVAHSYPQPELPTQPKIFLATFFFFFFSQSKFPAAEIFVATQMVQSLVKPKKQRLASDGLFLNACRLHPST